MEICVCASVPFVHLQSQRSVLGDFLYHSTSFFFKPVFYLARSLTTPRASSLFQVVSKPLRSTFLCSSCKTTTLGFYVDAGIRIRSSCLHIKHFLHWAISFSPLWRSLISCCCDKTLWQKQLKGEGFVQFTVSGDSPSWPKVTVAGAQKAESTD